MTTLLPKDADNNIIPALRLTDGGSHQMTATASAVSNSTPFNQTTKVISLYSTEPIYIKFGETGVMATNTDHFFPAGTYYDIAISGGAGKGPHSAFISALAVSADASVFISEKQ